MVTTRAERPTDANTGDAQPSEQAKEPAFVTTASLATYAGASAAAFAVWKALDGLIDASWVNDRWVPGAICLLIGVYLIWKGLEDVQKGSDKFGVILVGLFNVVVLWSAVVGADTGADAAGVADSTGTNPDG